MRVTASTSRARPARRARGFFFEMSKEKNANKRAVWAAGGAPRGAAMALLHTPPAAAESAFERRGLWGYFGAESVWGFFRVFFLGLREVRSRRRLCGLCAALWANVLLLEKAAPLPRRTTQSTQPCAARAAPRTRGLVLSHSRALSDCVARRDLQRAWPRLSQFRHNARVRASRGRRFNVFW